MVFVCLSARCRLVRLWICSLSNCKNNRNSFYLQEIYSFFSGVSVIKFKFIAKMKK